MDQPLPDTDNPPATPPPGNMADPAGPAQLQEKDRATGGGEDPTEIISLMDDDQVREVARVRSRLKKYKRKRSV